MHGRRILHAPCHPCSFGAPPRAEGPGVAPFDPRIGHTGPLRFDWKPDPFHIETSQVRDRSGQGSKSFAVGRNDTRRSSTSWRPRPPLPARRPRAGSQHTTRLHGTNIAAGGGRSAWSSRKSSIADARFATVFAGRSTSRPMTSIECDCGSIPTARRADRRPASRRRAELERRAAMQSAVRVSSFDPGTSRLPHSRRPPAPRAPAAAVLCGEPIIRRISTTTRFPE